MKTHRIHRGGQGGPLAGGLNKAALEHFHRRDPGKPFPGGPEKHDFLVTKNMKNHEKHDFHDFDMIRTRQEGQGVPDGPSEKCRLKPVLSVGPWKVPGGVWPGGSTEKWRKWRFSCKKTLKNVKNTYWQSGKGQGGPWRRVKSTALKAIPNLRSWESIPGSEKHDFFDEKHEKSCFSSKITDPVSQDPLLGNPEGEAARQALKTLYFKPFYPLAPERLLGGSGQGGQRKNDENDDFHVKKTLKNVKNTYWQSGRGQGGPWRRVKSTALKAIPNLRSWESIPGSEKHDFLMKNMKNRVSSKITKTSFPRTPSWEIQRGGCLAGLENPGL